MDVNSQQKVEVGYVFFLAFRGTFSLIVHCHFNYLSCRLFHRSKLLIKRFIKWQYIIFSSCLIAVLSFGTHCFCHAPFLPQWAQVWHNCLSRCPATAMRKEILSVSPAVPWQTLLFPSLVELFKRPFNDCSRKLNL